MTIEVVALLRLCTPAVCVAGWPAEDLVDPAALFALAPVLASGSEGVGDSALVEGTTSPILLMVSVVVPGLASRRVAAG